MCAVSAASRPIEIGTCTYSQIRNQPCSRTSRRKASEYCLASRQYGQQRLQVCRLSTFVGARHSLGNRIDDRLLVAIRLGRRVRVRGPWCDESRRITFQQLRCDPAAQRRPRDAADHRGLDLRIALAREFAAALVEFEEFTEQGGPRATRSDIRQQARMHQVGIHPEEPAPDDEAHQCVRERVHVPAELSRAVQRGD